MKEFLYRKLLKAISIFLLCFVCGSAAHAQHWCLPGATWYYTDESADVSGYTKLTYVSDTLINTINCKKITNYKKLTGWLNNYSYYHLPFYTYEQNGVAYLYNNRYGNNKFDTLFNINAQVGDKWHLPLLDTACVDSLYYMTVLDTGSRVLNGINLKWLYVQAGPLGGAFPYGFDTITERLGYRYDDICYSFVCNNGPDECAHGGLRCYSDSTFGLYSTNTNIPCDYFYTDISESKKNNASLSLFPNPANDEITIVFNDATPAEGNIEIRDMLGKLIHKTSLKAGVVYNYSTLELPRSIYMVSLYLGNKPVENKKLVLIN